MTFIMKRAFAGVLITSLCILVVSAHGSPPIEEKKAELVVVIDDAGLDLDRAKLPTLDVINDHAVIEVRHFPLSHQENVEATANGYKPAKEAKARAPTARETRLNTRPRDKPVRC